MFRLLSHILFAAYFLAQAASAQTPCWQSPSPSAEPLFFTGKSRADASATLLRIPTEAPVLKNARGETVYELNRDFTWAKRTRELRLTENSRIPFKTTAELYPPANSANAYASKRDKSAWMLYGAGAFWHDLQCHAAYTAAKSDEWKPPTVAAAPEVQLGPLRGSLKNQAAIRLTVLGDSISTGADASGVAKIPPLQPGYAELVARDMQKRSGSEVSLTNLSVGGMDANWGVTQVQAVIATKPDLLILAFGMNDASGRCQPEEFVGRIRRIIEPVKASLTHCSVVLVSPMTANAEWIHAAPDLYGKYANALRELCAPGIALADVTEIWTAVTKRKSYLDLTGNGLNHPNDYGHRLYADVILEVLGVPKK